MKKLILDGKDFTNDAVFDHKISYSRTPDRAEASKSMEISFTGDAYEYLNQIYFKDRNRKKVCQIEISPKNCDKTYYFQLGFREVKKCDCTIEANPISNQASKYEYLKKTLWYGNGFDEAYEHFRVFFITGFTFISIVMALIYPLLAIFVALLNAIDSILDIGDVPTLEDLNEVISGAGAYHVGYSITEVFEYHALKSGLTFQSSILQTDPYNKSVFIMADANDGFDDDVPVKFDLQNASAWSVLKLAQAFKKLHDAEFWIEGDILRYENRLVYETVDNVFVDVDSLDITLCEQYLVDRAIAFAQYKYGSDSMDMDCNQASDLYSDTVEYNNPPEDWRKGHLDYVIQDFSPIRYQQDNYDKSFWSTLVNELRFTLKGRKYDMLLSNSRASLMKVFVWDGASPRKDCRTKKWHPQGDDYFEYNYDYFINENPLGNPLVKPNLYDRFLYINDPNKFYQIERDDFEFSPCEFCDALDHLETYGIRSGIKKELDGIGIAEEITVNFDTMEVEVKKPVWNIPV